MVRIFFLSSTVVTQERRDCRMKQFWSQLRRPASRYTEYNHQSIFRLANTLFMMGLAVFLISYILMQ